MAVSAAGASKGLWEVIQHTLERSWSAGKRGDGAQPTAAVLDSQTVRSADHAGERGYDAGKKTKGRKRHILVDTPGLLLWVCVTPAQVSEQGGCLHLPQSTLRWFGWLRCLWGRTKATPAQPSLPGSLRIAARAPCVRKSCLVSKTSAASKYCANAGLSSAPSGWFMKHRRLVRDYETKLENAEALIHITMIGLMLRRLA